MAVPRRCPTAPPMVKECTQSPPLATALGCQGLTGGWAQNSLGKTGLLGCGAHGVGPAQALAGPVPKALAALGTETTQSKQVGVLHTHTGAGKDVHRCGSL